MTETQHYQFKLPAGSDFVGPGAFNDNFEALDGLLPELEAGKPLSGAGDPTGDTVGAVGQRYVNTASGEIFTCVGAADGAYTWKKDAAAATAEKLATARTIQVNLGSTAADSFDGSANVQPGVTGTLLVTRGGTGATSAAAARTNLGACAKVAPVTVSVPLSWSGSGPWTQTITVSGVTAADEHLGIFPAPVSDAASRKLQYAAYACLSPGNCETQAGKIKLVCDDKKPTVAFQIILKGVR